MENFVGNLKLAFEPRFLKDFKPEVRAIYKRRVEYDDKLTDIFEN